MINENFGEDLLHKIKEENRQPKPRWQFLLKNYVVWGLGAISLFLGAIATSTIFYMIEYSDLDVYGRAGGQVWEKVFMVIPFFWLVCLALFVFIVFYNIKHTKQGYRYSPVIVLFAVVCSSIILGGAFYAMGLGERIDNVMGRAPFYDRLINPRIDFWSRPGEGRLSGMITSQTNSDEYLLEDREKNEWKVYTKNMDRGRVVKLEVNLPARFLGESTGDHEFNAREILPMMPGKGFFDHLGPRGPRPPELDHGMN